MGMRPPPSPSPISLRQASAPLQRIFEGDVSSSVNGVVGPMYKGQGGQVGGASDAVYYCW